MRKIITSKQTTCTCDFCGKMSKEALSEWITFEMVEEIGLRVFEKKQLKSIETKHLTNRLELDFCTKECAISYNKNLFIEFLWEIKPPKNRHHTFGLL